MTHPQSAQIDRYRALEGVCDAHAAAWSAIPAFGTAKAALSAHLRTPETHLFRMTAAVRVQKGSRAEMVVRVQRAG